MYRIARSVPGTRLPEGARGFCARASYPIRRSQISTKHSGPAEEPPGTTRVRFSATHAGLCHGRTRQSAAAGHGPPYPSVDHNGYEPPPPSPLAEHAGRPGHPPEHRSLLDELDRKLNEWIEAEAILVRSIVLAAPASAGRVARLCKAHMISSREMPMSPRTPSGKRLNWSVADNRAFRSAWRRNHLRNGPTATA